MANPIGHCHLCMLTGKLTYEHIPPQRVFNSRPAICHTLWGLGIGAKHSTLPPVEHHRRGMGRHSLCQRCNEKTAHYYGDAFADWTLQALDYARKVGAENRVALPFRIKPLHVIKQVATMALAAAQFSDSDALRRLRRFVLLPFEQYLPAEFQVRAYLNPVRPGVDFDRMMTPNRLSEVCVIMDIVKGTSTHIFGEVAFPPMGYVVCLRENGQRLTEEIQQLADISHFSGFRFGETADLTTSLPVRNPFGPVPGNYARR